MAKGLKTQLVLNMKCSCAEDEQMWGARAHVNKDLVTA